MTDFGRVGRIKTFTSDCTFMVVSESDHEYVRIGKPSYRRALVLEGFGNVGDIVRVGEMGAVDMDDQKVEWLDD